MPPTLISRCSLLSFSPLLFIVLMEFVCKNVWLPSCYVATLLIKFRKAKHDTNAVAITLASKELLVFCHTSSKTSLPKMSLMLQCYKLWGFHNKNPWYSFLQKHATFLTLKFQLDLFVFSWSILLKSIFYQSWKHFYTVVTEPKL